MEQNLLRTDYLQHERIYAADPDASGWNDLAVDQVIFTYVEELLFQARVVPPATLLEVGCGMGNLTIPLARTGFEVIGIDISRTAVERATRRALQAGLSASFRVGNVILPETYGELAELDGVLDGLCWHCLIGQDRQAFLHCVRNALKPQGCFLVITMCGDPRSSQLQALFDPISRCITHGCVADRYLGMPQDLRRELAAAGLMVVYDRLVKGNNVTGDQDLFLAVARR